MSDDLTKNFSNENSGTLAQILHTVKKLDARVANLEQRMEERLYDTRPIWEKVLSDISELKEGQAELKAGQQSLRADVNDIRPHLRDMDREFSIFSDTFIGIQADYRDIYDRVREIERHRN